MQNKTFRNYYIISLAATLSASFYPIYMGVRVVYDMLSKGVVFAENYPKYIIPYTPISLAVIAGVLILPLSIRLAKRFSLLLASVFSTIVFFSAELLLENLIIVEGIFNRTKLESWQMFMCYDPGIQTERLSPIEILIGDYSPFFKLHFYIISIIIILTLLNCLYGFGQMIKTGNKGKLKALILQSVSAAVFLGLCIFACFTAFYRTGEIQISPLSASLMSIFFITMGVTAGIYTGSFLPGRKKRLSVLLPSAVASITTLIMYIGELILLSGNLYRFGSGFLFEGLGPIVLAPIDLLLILASGTVTAAIFTALSKEKV